MLLMIGRKGLPNLTISLFGLIPTPINCAKKLPIAFEDTFKTKMLISLASGATGSACVWSFDLVVSVCLWYSARIKF